jgi:CHAT domain-containing protein/tetratricopeptide (TPR) repeat protein
MVASALILAVSACQATAPKMSIEEARKVAAEFKVIHFEAPPRNIKDLRSSFRAGREIPNNCAEEIAKRRLNLKERLANLQDASGSELAKHRSYQLAADAESAMSIGQFELAIDLMRRAISALQSGGNGGNSIARVLLNGQLGSFYARIGNVDEALDQKGIAETVWFKAQDWAGYYDKSAMKLQLIALDGLIAHAEGRPAVAETFYRETIEAAPRHVGSGYRRTVNVGEMRTGLIRALVQQRRLTEAEAEAREALNALYLFGSSSRGYSGKYAGIMAMMATVFREQGRLDDAEYMARIAVNMHESRCSAPEALGLTQARKALVDILGQRENWKGVLEQVAKARAGLQDFPKIFAREFGTSLARAEAELYAGDAAAGRRLLESRLAQALKAGGENSLTASEIRGLLAIAEARAGNPEKAIRGFGTIVARLLTGNTGGEASNSGSMATRERILSTYMTLLGNLAEKGSRTISGVDIPGELLRLASAWKLGRVGHAVSAGWARAAVGNQALSELVREEQNLGEEARVLAETLAYVQSAPTSTEKITPIDRLKSRLNAVHQARRTLRNKILEGFPQFAELTSPKPMTITQMRARLSRNQALLAYHVGLRKTYTWALRKQGPLAFAIVPEGQNSLGRKVAKLRAAVDPGALQSLGDIPPFDVAVANGLYAQLLEPVKAGWSGASELLVVADGPLGALPFSMLVSQRGHDSADGDLLFSQYRDVAWLARDLSVTNLPSANALKSLGGTGAHIAGGAARFPFVGFGDPFFSIAQQAQARDQKARPVQVAVRGISLRSVPRTRAVDSAEIENLPRLADTRDEIIAIAATLKANPRRDVFLGEFASEAQVKSMDLTPYRVISFATHGLVPGDLNGLDQPALALSSPKVTHDNGDGLLTMNEILGLRLNADIAVLSACNTAAADGQGAEAVSGLGRAFLYAGTKALVVSNWPVHSEATTELMTRMFKSLANDNTLTRAEALRRTRLTMIDEGVFKVEGKVAFSYAHPIFWAPFTIVGDGGGAKAATN